MRATIWFPIVQLILLALVVAGCSTPEVIVRDRPVSVSMPVPQPCADKRPAEVVPLKDRITRDEWYLRTDPRQKAALVGAQGLDRQTYGEQLNAATAACPEVELP